jgi:hypothetical protein
VPTSALDGVPDWIDRIAATVLQRHTVDDLAHIQATWPAFERLVGLRGRRMFAKVDGPGGTYTVCTLLRADDPADRFGLESGTLEGGAYLRGRILGDAPAVYDRIGPGMRELAALADVDRTRPFVEHYRRADEIELWVPVVVSSR